MSCLLKIRAFQDELSPNERKIARFILANPALIRDYSSQNLANAVGVSQSSIVKFSQKLGYQGFPDLKLAIHEDVLLGENDAAQNDPVTAAGASDAAVRDRLYEVKNEAMRSTLQLNDEHRLAAAVHRSCNVYPPRQAPAGCWRTCRSRRRCRDRQPPWELQDR